MTSQKVLYPGEVSDSFSGMDLITATSVEKAPYREMLWKGKIYKIWDGFIVLKRTVELDENKDEDNAIRMKKKEKMNASETICHLIYRNWIRNLEQNS